MVAVQCSVCTSCPGRILHNYTCGPEVSTCFARMTLSTDGTTEANSFGSVAWHVDELGCQDSALIACDSHLDSIESLRPIPALSGRLRNCTSSSGCAGGQEPTVTSSTLQGSFIACCGTDGCNHRMAAGILLLAGALGNALTSQGMFASQQRMISLMHVLVFLNKYAAGGNNANTQN